MRDAARIEPMLTQLRAIWLEHPDMRLGQIITAAADGRSTFYIEDVELQAGLNRLDQRLALATKDSP